MSASGSPYAPTRIHRADGMECAACSAATHKNNPDSGILTYSLGSNLDM